MNKISARDMQVFVAGAFALGGSDALLAISYYLSYYFSTPSHLFIDTIVPHLICSLFLPLGISILMGNARALKLAKIWLWLAVITYSAGIIFVCCFLPHNDLSLLSNFVPDLIINVILLWLLKHSLSKNFEDNKPQSQPTS